MNTYKNPEVSVVIKSHTKNNVASRKNSNEPVAMRNALYKNMSQNARTGISFLLSLPKYDGSIFALALFANSLDDAMRFELTALDVEINTKMLINTEPQVPITFSTAVTATSFDDPTSSGVRL